MHISIDSLRRWLLVGVACVAAIIVAYLAVGRIQRWRSPGEHILPLPNGILQQTNGFTYSKSNQGRTLFTIHAARAEQLQESGQAELYDVRITLYGRVAGHEDRISGSQFHYDQKTGVATAKGEVHLDLQTPTGQPESEVSAEPGKGADHGIIHIKTQGLVFMQSLGIAATDQRLEFAVDGILGHAVGAEYDSDRGLLTLQSSIDAALQMHGQPVNLTATHAVLDHTAGESRLSHVAAHSPSETANAENVVIHSRKDGSIDHIDADGSVAFHSNDFGEVTAPFMQLWMDLTNRPQRANASGGIHYSNAQPLLQRTAEAADGEAIFGAKSALHLVHLNGNVTMHDRLESIPAVGKPPVFAMERNLSAAHLALTFAQNSHAATSKHHTELQTVHAEGNAKFAAEQPVAASTKPAAPAAKPAVTLGHEFREVDGDVLDGTLSTSNNKTYFSLVDGKGHTRLQQKSADGSLDTSTGDTVHVVMRPQTSTSAANLSAQNSLHSSQPTSIEIVDAVQSGNVSLSDSKPPAAPAKSAAVTSGRADRAEYTGANQHLVLTGNPQITDAGTTIWAERITLDQPTGNLLAEKSVKANYQQAENSDPVHIIADHAQMLHTQQVANFYGRAGADARLWQQGSQVSAPVLEIQRTAQTLHAYGDASAAQPVHAVFPSQSSGGVVRVASHDMLYNDGTHLAVFSGGVDVTNPDSRTRSRTATVWLQNPQSQNKPGTAKPQTPPPGPALSGNVERILAEGAVTVVQPGRHATGEALNYTAKDGHYLLTGTPAQPPKLVDDVKGTVSGASLLFESNDDTVIVSSAAGYKRPQLDTHSK